ncbi:hypothetical protein AB4Y89_20705 [Terriglobus sp. 2YAB30_2]|uniref:hypothetical protein n=1 Tax=Terriglobus sp. 2YAB30_2 TaxID=3233023 RepID=UPI003F9B21F7
MNRRKANLIKQILEGLALPPLSLAFLSGRHLLAHDMTAAFAASLTGRGGVSVTDATVTMTHTGTKIAGGRHHRHSLWIYDFHRAAEREVIGSTHFVAKDSHRFLRAALDTAFDMQSPQFKGITLLMGQARELVTFPVRNTIEVTPAIK